MCTSWPVFCVQFKIIPFDLIGCIVISTIDSVLAIVSFLLKINSFLEANAGRNGFKRADFPRVLHVVADLALREAGLYTRTYFILASSREQDESLMAMGTNWQPPSIPNISSAGSNVTRSTSYSRPGSQGTLNGSIGKRIQIVFVKKVIHTFAFHLFFQGNIQKKDKSA